MWCSRMRLSEYGGDVHVTQHWACGLLRHMKFAQHKALTANSKLSNEDFAQLKQQFLADVKTTVIKEDIAPALVINWDQTGIKIVSSSTWTMDRQGSRRIEVAGVGDKRMITVIFAGSLVEDFLRVQVIYQGKTNRCHPHRDVASHRLRGLKPPHCHLPGKVSWASATVIIF